MRQMVWGLFPLHFVAVDGFVLMLLFLSAKTHILSRRSQVSFDMAGLTGDLITVSIQVLFFFFF